MSAAATAVAYAERGWPLVPVTPDDTKRPHFDALTAVHGTPQWGGLRDTPPTPAQVRGWFERDPGCAVGLILGEPSGIVAADIDRPAVARQLRHPPTVTARTRRGFHVLFAAAGRVESRPRQPWGDFLGDGKYLVLPTASTPERRWIIGPDDHPLADLGDLAGPGLGDLCPKVEVLLPRDGGLLPRDNPSPPAVSAEPNGLARVDVAVAAALPVLGVHAPLGRKCSCPLPGHGPDRHPSAVTLRGHDGTWRLFCHHFGRPFTLAHVLAARRAGALIDPPPAPALLRYYALLWHLAGVRPVEAAPIAGLDGCSPGARRVAEAFALLVAIRRSLGDDGPAPFTRTFAAAWAAMPERAARDALHELRAVGVLEVAATHGRMRLFRLAQGAEGAAA